MAIGWVRAYKHVRSELAALKARRKQDGEDDFISRNDLALEREKFLTHLRQAASDDSDSLHVLAWGDVVELPGGLSEEDWTAVKVGDLEGFVPSDHVVDVKYVKRQGTSAKGLHSTLTRFDGEKIELLWGDLVQITKAGDDEVEVRARGTSGKMDREDLTDDSLLEVYFVDVGQGDGVLLRTPEGRHLLIDGGLARTKQLTGKNAADFVDWKFFFDYGDHRIRLDGMAASHADNDHYGGLQDLIRADQLSDRELDCLGVDIETFFHPGLSKWSEIEDADPEHKDGLGPRKDNTFIRLLGDRADAEGAVAAGAAEKLRGDWKKFIVDVLENADTTQVARVLVKSEDIRSGGDLPLFWPSQAGCDIRALGPVSRQVGDHLGLPDLGSDSINLNGHSMCLRVDYGSARILLTGDLNKKSMDWLWECYGDRLGAWECDVAKACHHGSHDISYRFLEKIRAAATVISSGDAEGHSHPRPEIVGASSLAGFHQVDRKDDLLVTPLIYLTEAERSVSLGALNRIDFRQLPVNEELVDGAILGRNTDEFGDKGYLTPEGWKAHDQTEDSTARRNLAKDIRREQKPILQAMEEETQKGKVRVDFNISVPQGPLTAKYARKRAWRSRIMEKTHYGLVNVRTDGETILCATLDETEDEWVIHTFPARFGD